MQKQCVVRFRTDQSRLDMADMAPLLRGAEDNRRAECTIPIISIIWSRIPRKVFVRVDTLKIGVYEAVSSYNKGNVSKCLVFKVLDLEPGQNCVTPLKKSDVVRIQKAKKAVNEIAKKCRKDTTLKRILLEEGEEEGEHPDNPSYAPGQY
ncbi:hypothetical protein J6590_031702 [Homalodisca vitripennis]|nr:hypothetical protein J6590_031702 [Homalodisca vitripennis]